MAYESKDKNMNPSHEQQATLPIELGLDVTQVTGFGNLVRRVSPRAVVRAAFLLIFVWACWQLWAFYQWTIGIGPYVPHPNATAGLVPLGAIMGLVAWMKTGVFDPILPASEVIVIGALVLSLLFKRGFCSWICPVGTGMSMFSWLGRAIFGRNYNMPIVIDRALRIPKYLISAVIIFQLSLLPAEIALEFQHLPYYATSDLKILYGLLHPTWWYASFIIFAAITSLIWGNTWCRYMCPLGALYSVIGVFSAGTVARDNKLCISCGNCTKACSAYIDVASAHVVRAPECNGCLDCVRSCPQPNALTARFLGSRMPWLTWPLLLVAMWVFIWMLASATGHWTHGLPDSIIAQYMQSIKLTPDT